MKRFAKWAALALAGVLCMCAVALSTGCFGMGGDSNKSGDNGGTATTDNGGTATTDNGSGGSGYGGYGNGSASEPAQTPSTPSPQKTFSALGTWKLAYILDGSTGKEVSVTQAVKDSIYLIVQEATATLYFRDEAPFSGTLVRNEERDAHYAKIGDTAKAYKLQGSSSYWEIVFVTKGDSAFWFIEIGGDDKTQHLYLTQEPVAAPAVDAKVGLWTLHDAVDSQGNAYKLTTTQQESVRLDVKADGTATFYYMDNDPFQGTLEHYADGDAQFTTKDYKGECYHLVGPTGSYWELAFIQKKDGSSCFWYLEVGAEGNQDSLFLYQGRG